MPTRRLPSRADIRDLKQQADDLRAARLAGDRAACHRIREFHPRFHAAADGDIRTAAFTLADARLTIAREHGFASWARLRAQVAAAAGPAPERPHHERIQDPAFRRAVDLLDDGDAVGLREHLAAHPGLIHRRVLFEGGNYFRDPALLEFVAENPVRHDSLPPNIVEVARVMLEAGAKDDGRAIQSALALVSSGRVPRECGVQIPLIDLLCDAGADPAGAMLPALGHGEMEAASALLRRGAPNDLPAAAAMGRPDDARRILPGSDAAARHLAIALAAQHGRAGIVALLLDAGEDPDRYNPPGAHAHSTPLHQAALAGHLDVVRLLAGRGARLDIRDILYGGTPLDWAEHAGQEEVAQYLRGRAGSPGRGEPR